MSNLGNLKRKGPEPASPAFRCRMKRSGGTYFETPEATPKKPKKENPATDLAETPPAPAKPARAKPGTPAITAPESKQIKKKGLEEDWPHDRQPDALDTLESGWLLDVVFNNIL